MGVGESYGLFNLSWSEFFQIFAHQKAIAQRRDPGLGAHSAPKSEGSELNRRGLGSKHALGFGF